MSASLRRQFGKYTRLNTFYEQPKNAPEQPGLRGESTPRTSDGIAQPFFSGPDAENDAHANAGDRGFVTQPRTLLGGDVEGLESRALLDYVDDFLFGERENRTTLCQDHRYSLSNLLVILTPFAIVAGATGADKTLVFCLNYLVLLSLPGLFRYGCEVLSAQIPRRGGWRLAWDVLSSTFALDLEIIVIALCKGRLTMVKSYIVGKIVATCLLTMGVCFITSGARRNLGYYNFTGAQALAALLLTSVAPSGILFFFPADDIGRLSLLSRVASFVLLLLYALYLWFRLRSHRGLFISDPEDEANYIRPLFIRSPGTLAAVIMLLVPPVLTYFCSAYIFDTLSGELVISDVFMGFCLIPLLIEVPEIAHISWYAYTDQMDFALGLAVGSSVHTALFVSPVLCLLAWNIHQPLTLQLGLFEMFALLATVRIFGLQVQTGTSHWVSGAQIIGLYIVLSMAIYFIPG